MFPQPDPTSKTAAYIFLAFMSAIGVGLAIRLVLGA